MKNTHTPSGGQPEKLPAGTPALPESIDLLFILPGKDGKPVTHLHAEDAVAAGDAYWHIDPLGGERTLRPCVILPSAKRSPFKRTGKGLRNRPGFVSRGALCAFAGALVWWALIGVAMYWFMVYATR